MKHLECLEKVTFHINTSDPWFNGRNGTLPWTLVKERVEKTHTRSKTSSLLHEVTDGKQEVTYGKKEVTEGAHYLQKQHPIMEVVLR